MTTEKTRNLSLWIRMQSPTFATNIFKDFQDDALGICPGQERKIKTGCEYGACGTC